MQRFLETVLLAYLMAGASWGFVFYGVGVTDWRLIVASMLWPRAVAEVVVYQSSEAGNHQERKR